MNRFYERDTTYSEVFAAFKNPEKRIINLLLLGKAGVGKSATGNTILQRHDFMTSDNKMSAPPACQLECSESDDMLVRVVDTPGLMGTQNDTPDEVLEVIFSAMSLCPEGFNALIYVMAYGDRFTQEDKDVLTVLKKCFGEKFVEDFCVVVFSKGDSFYINMEEQGETNNFRRWLEKQAEPKEFKEFISQCQNRVLLFNNIGIKYQTEREKSRNELFEMLSSLRQKYTSLDFQLNYKCRTNLVSRLKNKYQSQNIQDLLSLIKQYLHKSISANDEMATAVNIEEVKTINLKINENILKANETVENLSALMRKEGENVRSVNKLADDLHTILANTKITTRPSQAKLNQMLKSLLEKS